MALAPYSETSRDREQDELEGPYAANSPTRPSPPPAGPASDEDDEPPEGRMTFLEHLD